MLSFITNESERSVTSIWAEIPATGSYQFPDLSQFQPSSMDCQLIMRSGHPEASDTISYNTLGNSDGDGLQINNYSAPLRLNPEDIKKFRARSLGSASAWLYCEVRSRAYIP